MVLTQDEIRDIVLPLLDRYDMKSASLFGSYARGDADEGSDIDVLLVGNEGFRPSGIFGLAEELHTQSGKAVDVYEQSELSPGPFRDAVYKELVLL